MDTKCVLSVKCLNGFITVGTQFIPAVKCLKLISCNFLSQCKLYFHNFEDCYKVILTTQLMQERYDNTFATYLAHIICYQGPTNIFKFHAKAILSTTYTI